MRYQAELIGGPSRRARFEIMDTQQSPPHVVARCVGRPDADLITNALNGAALMLAEAAQ